MRTRTLIRRPSGRQVEFGIDWRQWMVGFNAYPSEFVAGGCVNVFLGPLRLSLWGGQRSA